MHAATIGQPVGVHVEMTLVNCASCGISFGMPSDLNRRRREDGKDFHCPNGHINVYKSDLDTLRKKVLDAEGNAIKWEKAYKDLNQALSKEQAAHEATRKQVAKLAADKQVGGVAPAVDPPAKPPVIWVTVDERIVKCLSDGKTKHYKVMADEIGIKHQTLNPALSKAHAKGLVVREGLGMYRLPTKTPKDEAAGAASA